MNEQVWDLGPLLRVVRKRPDDSADMLKFVSSVGRSLAIISYHVFQARDAVEESSIDDEAANLKAFAAVVGHADEQEAHDNAMLVSQAHTVAGIHAARNAVDIFAQLANQMVVSPSIAVEKCDIYKVANALRQLRPRPQVTANIDELLAMKWFKYVEAYTNTSKHRKLIDHLFSVSFEHGTTEVRIGGFDYLPRHPKGAAWQRYPSYSIREVLAGVLDVRNRLISCGAALNAVVIGRGTTSPT